MPVKTATGKSARPTNAARIDRQILGGPTDTENRSFSGGTKVMTWILGPRCRSNWSRLTDHMREAIWSRVQGLRRTVTSCLGLAVELCRGKIPAIATKRLFDSKLACCGMPDFPCHLHRAERAPKLQRFRRACARRPADRPAVQPALTPTMGPLPRTEDPPRAAVVETHRTRDGCGFRALFGLASPAAARPAR